MGLNLIRPQLLKKEGTSTDKEGMKDKTCLVCKYSGHIKTAVERDAVFQENGNPIFIDLCYNHSVEFFKSGQKKFIAKYNTNIVGQEFSAPAEKSWFR